MAIEQPFWKTMTLAQMSREQWESLCDGCGRCCLQKFQDGKTGKVTYTWVSCYLLDVQACGCVDYGNRTSLVPDCLVLTAEQIPRLRWLPEPVLTGGCPKARTWMPGIRWYPVIRNRFTGLVYRCGARPSQRCTFIRRTWISTPSAIEFEVITESADRDRLRIP
jgi:uncharacterized cysteine cluster protein YcgN (CxxCxxCC family)